MEYELTSSQVSADRVTASPQRVAGYGHASNGWALASIALASVLVPLNSTMVAVALPNLMAAFHVGVATAAWLITGYLATMACCQPIGGRLGDRFGRRQLIIFSLAAFGIASLGAALAPNFGLLVLFRLGQAASGAIIIPNGAALVREAIPTVKRGGAYGLVGAAIGVGAAAGPPLGGILARFGDWRAIFALNVPLAVALAALACWALPRIGGQSGGVRQPPLDLRLFRSRSFGAATAAMGLSNLSMYCLLLAIPQLLAREGWDSALIGLTLVPLPAGMVLLGPPGGWLADRLGRRWPVVVGLGLLVLGSAGVAIAGAGPSRLWLAPALGLAGAGLGVAQSGLQSGAVEGVSRAQVGSAAGLFSSGRYLGSIAGSSALAILLGSTDGFRSVYLMVIAAAVASVVLSLGLRDWPEQAAPVQSVDPQGSLQRSGG